MSGNSCDECKRLEGHDPWCPNEPGKLERERAYLDGYEQGVQDERERQERVAQDVRVAQERRVQIARALG